MSDFAYAALRMEVLCEVYKRHRVPMHHVLCILLCDIFYDVQKNHKSSYSDTEVQLILNNHVKHVLLNNLDTGISVLEVRNSINPLTTFDLYKLRASKNDMLSLIGSVLVLFWNYCTCSKHLFIQKVTDLDSVLMGFRQYFRRKGSLEYFLQQLEQFPELRIQYEY